MSSQTLGLRVGGTVFGLIAVGQLIRLLTQAEVLIAGRALPLWVSGVAVVVAGSLSCWLWRLSGCCCAKPPSAPA
ncbi:MAG: hypothetical protein HYY24_09355 [Verrucomicrobia bacterium]|nr:hypothetical protein [Verrucomicrobiota bacterium]